MAININRYVSITSGVAGGAQLAAREYIARIFTANPLLPPQTYVEFPNAAAVGAFFGLFSEEYYRAQFYYSFLSKTFTQPQNMSFGRWVYAASAPMIFGYNNPAHPQVYTTYSAHNDGSIGLTIGGVAHMFTDLDFTAVVDLAGVASVLQTAVSGVYAGTTVVYNALTGNFILTGGTPGAATISVQAGVGGTDISGALFLNWLPVATFTNGVFSGAGAIWASGSAAETPVQSVTTSIGLSNNFGSFAFMPVFLTCTLATSTAVTVASSAGLSIGMYVYGVGIQPGTTISAIPDATHVTLSLGATVSASELLAFTLNPAQIASLATYAESLNVVVMYMAQVNALNYAAIEAAVVGIGANGQTLAPQISANAIDPTNQYPEMFPMMIQASTNYTAQNSVQNYEFQQVAGLTPSVTTDAAANQYDAVQVNYYGQTQQAGQFISFYQKGVLNGLPTDPLDMNVFANEIWLKDAATVALMQLLLSATQVPANYAGRNMILTTIQGVVNQALFNGTISVGKNLTSSQIAFITEATNDPNAWYQVQTIGYWIDAQIVGSGSPVTYTATYTLIYSKDDVVRKVVGTDILI